MNREFVFKSFGILGKNSRSEGCEMENFVPRESVAEKKSNQILADEETLKAGKKSPLR